MSKAKYVDPTTEITRTSLIDSSAFKVWVDVPWNGPLSSGKYNISVEWGSKQYVIDPWWNLTWYESRVHSWIILVPFAHFSVRLGIGIINVVQLLGVA